MGSYIILCRKVSDGTVMSLLYHSKALTVFHKVSINIFVNLPLTVREYIVKGDIGDQISEVHTDLVNC